MTGRPFDHFLCPILFADEQTDLCEGHVVNRAFGSPRSPTVVQRKDVDNFYGSHFEADFLDSVHIEGLTPIKLLSDNRLSRRFKARVLLEGKPVQHFYDPRFTNPDRALQGPSDLGESTYLGLLIHPEDRAVANTGHWQVEISRDIRLPYLVSALKAAHLSLFHMLGYRYAYSAAGYFLGKSVLGEFFLQHRGTAKREIADAAREHFSDYVHMLRPLISTELDLNGTVHDHQLLLLRGGSGRPWAFMVVIATGNRKHFVIVPTLETVDQANTFLGFLSNSNQSIQAATCTFDRDCWRVSANTFELNWPKNGTMYL